MSNFVNDYDDGFFLNKHKIYTFKEFKEGFVPVHLGFSPRAFYPCTRGFDECSQWMTLLIPIV